MHCSPAACNPQPFCVNAALEPAPPVDVPVLRDSLHGKWRSQHLSQSDFILLAPRFHSDNFQPWESFHHLFFGLCCSCIWTSAQARLEAWKILSFPSFALSKSILSRLSTVIGGYLPCCCLAVSGILEKTWPAGINYRVLGFEWTLEIMCLHVHLSFNTLLFPKKDLKRLM